MTDSAPRSALKPRMQAGGRRALTAEERGWLEGLPAVLEVRREGDEAVRKWDSGLFQSYLQRCLETGLGSLAMVEGQLVARLPAGVYSILLVAEGAACKGAAPEAGVAADDPEGRHAAAASFFLAEAPKAVQIPGRQTDGVPGTGAGIAPVPFNRCTERRSHVARGCVED